MDPKRPCHRTRNVCHHCQQNLGYTALRRHRDLPHLYCPGYAESVTEEHGSSDSESSDSTFTLDEPSPHSPQSNYSEHRTLVNLALRYGMIALMMTQIHLRCSTLLMTQVYNILFASFSPFFNFAIVFQTKLCHTSCYSFLHFCIISVLVSRILHIWLH